MDPNTTSTDKTLQDDLKDSAHRIWLAGLGALAAAEEEGTKVFQRLVERGREWEAKGKVEVKETYEKARTKAESTWGDVGGKVDEAVTSALHRLGVPTRDEIRNLTLKVEELTAKVENLRPRTATEPPIVMDGTLGGITPNPDAKIIG
ncbi:MAG TPA: phasin family protein [Thermoanaerobaculia bacterium]|jgi:poly(hydroxyalkanoate) granule-associated protein|nr:phasin family protein [Thermoanaerobaculia bacterium]